MLLLHLLPAATANDPAAIAELMKDLDNPEIMAEVNKLMADPSFKREMKGMEKAMKDAADMLADPKKMEEFARQAEQYADLIKNGPGFNGAMDAALGMDFLSKAGKDPNMLAEAMAVSRMRGP